MFDKIVGSLKPPKYISHDNDPLFQCYRWEANMRILKGYDGCSEIWTVLYVPTSHPFCERLIGSVRREFTDKIFFVDAVDLEKKLLEYAEYFNHARVHYAHDGKVPSQKYDETNPKIADFNKYKNKSYCRGLFKVPMAV